MKKYNIGDSVKLKSGKVGVIEDYDNNYYYVKDTNCNIIKVKKISDNDFDYGTEEVNGSDIFDIHTTGMTGTYEDLLKGIDRDYYINNKNLKAQIVQMSPKEYYDRCSKMFREKNGSSSTSEDLISQRRNDEKSLEELKKIILEKKKKFPIPVLDISHEAGQEGLHRMMVAGDLFGWDTKFPVLLVETYDEKKQKRIQNNSAQKDFENFMKNLLNDFKHYEFYDLDEFFTMLGDRIEDKYHQSPILSVSENKTLEVIIDCEETNDSLVYYIDLSGIKIAN